MKHTNIYILSFTILCLSGCSFLDFDETDGLYTHDDIYSYLPDTKKMLTNVYSYIPQDFGTIGGAMRDCACDDAEFGDAGASVQDFNTGNWSAVNTLDSSWSLYRGVRAANEFIASIAETDFSRYENDASYSNMVAQLKYFPYEARMLRAYFFFELAKRYGDIPMPLKVLSTGEANSIEKTPFDDVVEFIVSECDECRDNLPVSYISEPNAETGRITSGFAMALKSKALLYAASELHNPGMDRGKWLRSAKAALELIDSGTYSLDPSDKCGNLGSPEVVLFRMNGNSTAFELNNFPIRYTEGRRSRPASATFPTQNLVDAFQTRNGYSVRLAQDGWLCDDPQFDPQNPWSNRDPRFMRTVLANGSVFKGSVIECYAGGKDDNETALGGSPTGYFLRKYIRENVSFVPNQTVTDKHHWIVYRYAETLLAYAESMIEAFGDPDYTDADFIRSASWALNSVRANAGMPAVRAGDKASFIAALRNEWRVEFAFEDHRFWDVRRWKIAGTTQTAVYGVKIRRDRTTGYSCTRVLLETRAWRDAFYLYPIPQAELFKNPALAPQNRGW